MGWFVPNDFKPTFDNIEWAMKKFSITRNECEAQAERMIDHEFVKEYSDWQRVFRNWLRKADDFGILCGGDAHIRWE